MSRPHRARALAVALALGATACQDYNFNPVGHCLIQPGSQRFTLSNISTADVLFVVDDSNSMAGEQAALANAFDAFVTNLTDTNATRQAAGLLPIDFHVAVTTSSVYYNFESGATCSTTCGSATGTPVCCNGSTPARRPRRCTANSDCSGLGTGISCRLDCDRFKGELVCCSDSGAHAPPAADLVTCSRVGTGCGDLQTHYNFADTSFSCSTNIARDFDPFPAGDFVSYAPDALTTPYPRVLHFDKSLYQASGKNQQGFDPATLVTMFKRNVQVGTCGSGQEQALQAGRLAIQKGLAGRQKDTWRSNGTPAWTPPVMPATLPGSAPASWPNGNSKIVMVFVGDEDDCSAPADASGGVVMLASQPPGFDACTRDEDDPRPHGQKEYLIDEFVSFFTGLGRPVAAAFILPAAQTTCNLQTCTTAGLCGGAVASGKRLLETAQKLSDAGVEVVAGSICDPNFGSILNDIANIAKPPDTLELPTVPAEGRITVLRIIGSGDDARLCGPALAPELAVSTLAAAKSSGADWWFVSRNEPGPPALDPTGASSRSVPYPTKYVYINPIGSCRANPGETYSADYIGVSPASSPSNPTGGCVVMAKASAGDTSPADNDVYQGPLVRSLDCKEKLGGRAEDWTCFVPPGLTRGTCTCKSSQ